MGLDWGKKNEREREQNESHLSGEGRTKQPIDLSSKEASGVFCSPSSELLAFTRVLAREEEKWREGREEGESRLVSAEGVEGGNGMFGREGG